MCLDILNINKDIHVAEADIIVYKYLRVVGKNLETPFQNFPVKIGEKYESELNVRSMGDIDKNVPDDYVVKFVTNGLHSFVRFKDAYNAYIRCSNRVVVECVIPKDSKYYIGEFDGLLSYASTELVYVKKYSKLSCFFKNTLN